MTRSLHPTIRGILDQLDADGVPGLSALSVEGSREMIDELFASDHEPGELDEVTDYKIAGPNGPTPIRVYTPRAEEPLPVLLWFHGGGWALGGLDLQDPFCRTLSDRIGCVVVSVDYRLAPENPFPTGLEDCYAATEWVVDNSDILHGDAQRVAIGGSSAGGNLAAAVAQMARDRRGPPIRYQVLLYPPTDRSFDTDSYHENSTGYFLTRTDMMWFWDLYLSREIDAVHPYAAPLRARELTDLPPATVVTCGFDPVRDEGIEYAERLQSDGVAVEARHYEDMIHGFLTFATKPELDIDVADDAMNAVIDDLVAALSA